MTDDREQQEKWRREVAPRIPANTFDATVTVDAAEFRGFDLAAVLAFARGLVECAQSDEEFWKRRPALKWVEFIVLIPDHLAREEAEMALPAQTFRVSRVLTEKPRGEKAWREPSRLEVN